MYRSIELKTMTPIYLPSYSYSEETIEALIDTQLENRIDIPFAPLFKGYNELLRILKYGGVINEYSGVYIVKSIKRGAARSIYIDIDEYERASLLLKPTIIPYRGFTLHNPFRFTRDLYIDDTSLLYLPDKAIKYIPQVINKIITTITGYGLNLALFIDYDGFLTRFYSKPKPPPPWTWSYLVELLREVISRSDAERHGFMFCHKANLLLIESIASTPIDLVVLDPTIYDEEELRAIGRIGESEDIAIGIAINTSYIEHIRRILLRASVPMGHQLRYISLGCEIWRNALRYGLVSIVESIRALSSSIK